MIFLPDGSKRDVPYHLYAVASTEDTCSFPKVTQNFLVISSKPKVSTFNTKAKANYTIYCRIRKGYITVME